MGLIRVCLFMIVFVLISTFVGKSQTAPDRYWVQFNNKNNTPFSILTPEEYLSDKAIQKRKRFGIPIQENDLPINPQYISSVLSLGNIELINKSKWFNAITVKLTDSLLLEAIRNLPFVTQVKHTIRYRYKLPKTIANDKLPTIETTSDYGYSYPQIRLHSGQLLHELGYNGEGIDIAIFDAGFHYANELPVFEQMRSSGRIIETKDFTDGDENVYAFSSHGKNVLSIIGGYERDSLIGSAFMANYYLFITEEVSFENIVEEDNWVAAAEYADSIGIDIINTSLGYSLFDDSLQNHTYSDMDGNTTRITIASDIAASKGIIPVTSAGNSGSNSWHYITAPADCDSCLTVGAVDSLGTYAFFSSYGPTFDGRIKPDVVSVGWHTAYAKNDSTFGYGNGTSYSSPLLAGLTACLWQAFPDKNNIEIIEAIRKSAHLYQNPNDSLGYGIPNFWQAFLELSATPPSTSAMTISTFPSPFTDGFSLVLNNISPYVAANVKIIDSAGRLVFVDKDPYLFHNESSYIKRYDTEIGFLTPGLYTVIVNVGNEILTKRVEKIE